MKDRAIPGGFDLDVHPEMLLGMLRNLQGFLGGSCQGCLVCGSLRFRFDSLISSMILLKVFSSITFFPSKTIEFGDQVQRQIAHFGAI